MWQIATKLGKTESQKQSLQQDPQLINEISETGDYTV